MMNNFKILLFMVGIGLAGVQPVEAIQREAAPLVEEAQPGDTLAWLQKEYPGVCFVGLILYVI